MRLPMWFAVGRALPEVRGWVLIMEQKTEIWSTDASEQALPHVVADRPIGSGTGLAAGIALRSDPTEDIEAFARTAGPNIGHLLVLGPEGGPHSGAVPSGAWAAGWAQAARDIIRRRARAGGNDIIHLFIAAPAGSALMLGHFWNMLPATVPYEFVPSTGAYLPTLTVE